MSRSCKELEYIMGYNFTLDFGDKYDFPYPERFNINSDSEPENTLTWDLEALLDYGLCVKSAISFLWG